ncbi:MAG: PQQ-binding-like beta-propeller repeat protein [Myxococcota bacterium]
MNKIRANLKILILIIFSVGICYSAELDGLIPVWQALVSDNLFIYKPVEYSGLELDKEFGRVFLSNKNGEIVSVDSDTGKILWRYKTGYISHRKPILSNNILFLASTEGKINAIDVSKKRPAQLFTRDLSGGIISEITLDGDRIFLLTERNTLYCLNMRDGTTIFQVNNDFNEGFSIYTDTPILAVKDYIVYTISTGELFVLNKSDGKLLYKLNLYNPEEKIDGFSGLFDLDEYIILSTYSGSLYKLELKTGKILWSRNLSGITSIKVDKENNNIYLANNDGTISIIDIDGKLLLKRRPLKEKVAGIDILGKRLIVRYLNGYIVSFLKTDLNPITFFRLSSPVISEINYDNRFAYLFSSKGLLIKILIK